MQSLQATMETLSTPRPAAISLSDGDLPDAFISSAYRLDGERRGYVLQLITPQAFSLFPEAPTDGPARGLLWFPISATGYLSALEERHGLYFHGVM